MAQKRENERRIENPCIWMQAGVVTSKKCNNFFDCPTCRYDAGMQVKVQRGKQMSWQDAMRRRSDLDRICRHSLTCRIGGRTCHHNYECTACDFDQFFEDVWSAKTKNMPAKTLKVKGFDVPMGYHFHNGHTWAKIESGGYYRIGLDDFALKVLGKADALDLPLVGKELKQNRTGWRLIRNEHAADVLSPVGGVIVEVNTKVKETPYIANQEPYGDGWLFLVWTPDIKKSTKTLVTGRAGLEWMDGEVCRLEQLIENAGGPLAADGGYIQEDVFGNLPDLGWTSLTKAFLKTG